MTKIVLIIMLVFSVSELRSEEIRTISPNGKIEIAFKTGSGGIPYYRISYANYRFLNWSALGFVLAGSGSLQSGLKVVSAERKQIDETYPVISGKSKYSRNYCNETKIVLEESAGGNRKLEIYFRAYNDGAAFRYGLPKQPGIDSFVISTEETYFNFAGDYSCWALKRDRFRQSYEGEYRPYKLSTMNNSPGDSFSYFEYTALPLTLKVNDDIYLSLSEANITNYPGMYLMRSQGNSLMSKLSPDSSYKDISVRSVTPAVSPWRLFIIGNDPGRLIESNLIMNLNEPNKIADAKEWIKPGKSTWSWWAEDRGFDPAFGYQILSTKTVKYYIDFAAADNFQYVTLDGGWYGWFDATRDDAVHDITKSLPELNLPEVSEYAKSKDIGLILWVVWYELEKQLNEALNYYQSLGIKGIKMDFMDRDDQYMTEFYAKVAEECARRKMFVTFHGAYKPDGLKRTYPNILSYEGVLGNEYARWSQQLPDPKHNVMLAFTRLIAGPMDYTPGSMTNVIKDKNTGQWKYPMTSGTRAQQMAMTVIYESGILSLCESPKIYEKNPEFEFLKEVPVTWDSTIVLSGEIGEYIVIARKKDNIWFIGAMTNWDEREIEIDFSFLENRKYSAEVYQDATDANTKPEGVKIIKTSVNRSDEKTFWLAKGGGLAIVLKP